MSLFNCIPNNEFLKVAKTSFIILFVIVFDYFIASCHHHFKGYIIGGDLRMQEFAGD